MACRDMFALSYHCPDIFIPLFAVIRLNKAKRLRLKRRATKKRKTMKRTRKKTKKRMKIKRVRRKSLLRANENKLFRQRKGRKQRENEKERLQR